MSQLAVIAGSVLALWGALVYAKDTYQGKTKPNRVSWFLWGSNTLIGAIIAFAGGAGLAALPILAASVGPFIILLASFANEDAYWKMSAFDYWCGACGILAILFWLLAQNPFMAIVLALLGDTLASLPTLKKAWQAPETETAFEYVTIIISSAIGLVTLERFVFSDYGFLLYLLIMNIVLVLVIKRKALVTN